MGRGEVRCGTSQLCAACLPRGSLDCQIGGPLTGELAIDSSTSEEEEEEEEEQERDPEPPVTDVELKRGEEDEGEEWEPNRRWHLRDWEAIMGDQERLAYNDLQSESKATADSHSQRHPTPCEGTCEGVRGGGPLRDGGVGLQHETVLVKRKNQNLYRVCCDFRILNEKLVKINHAFLLVRDCIEQLGRKKCHYLSMIDLRDAFHTL